MFFCEKIKKYKEKVQWKSSKTAISGIFPAFSAGKKFSLKIGLGHVLSIANARLYGKNQKKLMMKSRENAKKPVFPANFRHFRPEMNFFRKIFFRSKIPEIYRKSPFLQIFIGLFPYISLFFTQTLSITMSTIKHG